MLAVLTDEQEALQDVAKRIAETVALHNPADLDGVDRAGGWKRLAEVGVLGLRTREDGFPLATGTEVRLVAESLAEALAPIPFVGASLAVELLSLGAAPKDLVDDITSGAIRCGLGLRSDLSSLANLNDGQLVGWDVDGAELVVALGPDGDSVDVLTVLVDVSSVTPSPLDRTRSIAHLSWEGATKVGSVSREALMRWEALALTAVSADAVGAMRRTLDNAVAYSKDRIAYGVPIGSFQALQHLMVDAYVNIQPAASLTSYAAWAVDALEPAEALLAARSAKAYSARVGLDIMESAMQVFGGVGVTSEHIAHFFTRRVLADRYLFGPEDTHFALIADSRLVVN
ncbi:acyl-CoA dehydrogenase family protein [Rhodococcus koreensis]|uniref:acyl-CoA dehydrogenase family protein n=1 Tax=Rhodococcus koreensis TaxID=99653 RepID=UPI00366D79A0